MTGRKADVILAAHLAAETALRLVKPGNEVSHNHSSLYCSGPSDCEVGLYRRLLVSRLLYASQVWWSMLWKVNGCVWMLYWIELLNGDFGHQNILFSNMYNNNSRNKMGDGDL